MQLFLFSVFIFIVNIGQAKLICPGRNVFTIERPTGGEKNFSYTYEYNCKDPSLPTVIYIPGGPGLPSIRSNPLAEMNVNVIATDPRGSGINASYWAAEGKEKDLSTEKVAEDIVALVENQKLNNYSIYGSSFGTAVATIAANKLETSQSKYLPNSIILEGVVGRAEQDNEQRSASKKVFQQMKAEGGFCVTCKLDSLQNSLSSNQIGNLVDNVQSLGIDVAADILKKYTIEKLVEVAINSSDILGENEKKFYNAVACREYFLKGLTDTGYKDGELTGPYGGTCGDQKRDRPFDSKAWQVKTKTYYIVGTSDNFTPVSQVRYHFENQKNANKEVICVPRGGHTPLKYNIPMCSKQVFTKMSGGLNITANDLSSCNASVQEKEFTCGQ